MAGITGCAFYYRPAGGKASGEKTTGPSGLTSRQTSNRAELRAVIAALQYRVWYHRKYGTKPGEGREKVIIATDSQYVVLGITEWIRTWVSNNKLVANRDLWEELLNVLRKLD